jgi:adenine-specific DNA-methyltransferase
MILNFNRNVQTQKQNLEQNIPLDQNTLVVGDNIDLLHTLVQQGSQVDLIYIDPPYNTKKNVFKYKDTRKTEEWVSFLYQRLVLSQKVLSDKGAILISIDDNHYPYLKLLMDEIFGISNFVANFIWKKSHTVKNDKAGISTQQEYVLCFAKKRSELFFNREQTGEGYINKAYRYKDDKGRYRVVPLHKDKNKTHYSITSPNGTVWTKGWNYNAVGFQKLMDENMIYWGLTGNNCPSKKVYLKEIMDKSYGSILPTSVGYTGDGKKDLENLGFPKSTFLYAKPVDLIKHFLDIFSHKDSVVLDFFAGSGTTGQAILAANNDDNGNRIFLLGTNNEGNIADDVTFPRLQKSFKKHGSDKNLTVIRYKNTTHL